MRLIGHRGAAAYAPEHTLASYELALRQGADAIEQDLHLTRDGVLVCLHDRTLDRTTNVRDVFPDRAPWFVHDFTVDEIKQLDAGSWFARCFASARILTFQEVIDHIGTRGALLPELKDPEVYETLGIDILACFADIIAANGLDRLRARTGSLVMQSFHERTMRRAATMFDGRVPLVLLIEPHDMYRYSNRDAVAAVSAFVDGIGPGKPILEARPELVRWAQEAGLRVTPWTFREPASRRFGSLRGEMSYYLSELGVDAVITDNPDQAPIVQSS
jgi:glycerophosphoryl diester phosphodiesterase